MTEGQVFLLVSGIVLILVGTLFALIGIRKMQQGNRIMSCPPVEATVTEYIGERIDEDESSVSKMHVYRISYRIEGKAYEIVMQCFNKKYEVGDKLPVRYDPKSPMTKIYFDKPTAKGISTSHERDIGDVPTGIGWFIGAVLFVSFGIYWMMFAL